jgi:ADP-heptose:LPS heptosyltransferase
VKLGLGKKIASKSIQRLTNAKTRTSWNCDKKRELFLKFLPNGSSNIILKSNVNTQHAARCFAGNNAGS